ncbi:MAG TPA: hypothetical protein VHN14_07985 [Kofleriaceae bacterium]|nr:hypothetical protein [Kofleriaceae bacterium]
MERRNSAAGEAELEPAARAVDRPPGNSLGAAAHDDGVQRGVAKVT